MAYMSEQSTWSIPEWTPGDRFRKARETLNLSQTAFAERLNITKTTVSNYETDATTHHRNIIVQQWALATGVSPDWILHGIAPGEGPDGPGGLASSPSRQITNRIAVVTVLPLQSAEKDAA